MIEDNLYREVLLERLANPIGQGILERADVGARLVNPLCGDVVLIQLKIKNNTIEQAVYSGNGCAVSQVSASFLVESIIGKSLEDVTKLRKKDLLSLVGINPGPSREKCSVLSLQVLKKALKQS